MTKRTTALIVAILLILIAGIIVWDYSERSREAAKQDTEINLRIAVVTWVGFGPFYIASEKGYFEEEGLSVDLVRIDDFGSRRAALASGELDGSVETIDSLAIGAANELPAVLVLIVDESAGGDGIVARSEIGTIADLRGREVAVAETTPSHFFLLYLLDEAGVSASEVKVRPMEAGDAGSAFVAERVPAAVTWEPWLSQVRQTDHGRVLATTADYPGVIADTFVVHPDLIKDNPEAVRSLLNAWFKALDYLSTNRQSALDIMAENLEIPQEELAGMLEGVHFPSRTENLKYFEPRDGANKFERLFGAAIRLWKSAGEIDQNEEISVNYYYDPSFLKESSNTE